MIRLTKFALAATLLLALQSCGTTNTASVSAPATIRNARSAHVIKPNDSSRDIDKFLQRAISEKGVRTSVMAPSQRSNSDLTVTYVDRWHWDMVMYLRTLDISVLDPAGNEVATAKYRNSALHSYPDPETTTKGLVDQIFEKSGR